MRNSFTWRMGISTAGWLALTAIAAHAQPVVWVTPSLQRTGPTDPAGSGTQAQISAGKGEYESFQIVVRGPASGLTGVNVSVSNLTGPGGATIPSSSFSLFREHYVNVSPGSANWSGTNQPLGPGTYPDGLIPFNDPNTGASLSNSGASLVAVPFNLNASTNQPIWVDLLVPRTAAAGQYSGTFTVTSTQGSTSGTISLTVWNFTLPLKSSLRSTFEFWNTSGLAPDEELLRNKVEPTRGAVSDQSTLMNNYGLRDTGLPFFSGADVSTCTMSPAPSVSQIQASAASQTPGLSPYIYSADEITNCASLYTTMQQWGYNMHQAGVNNLVTMAPVPALFSDGSGTGRSAVDIWTMLPVTYNGATSLVAQALAKGDSAWSYNTLVQDSYSPKWEIDFAPINFRIQPGFISQSLGLTGLLYWKVDGWNATDPWNQVNNTGVFSTNNYPGEGQLVYPGMQVGISGVAPSMRLKWIRDGVEDFEYVAMLKALGQGTQALSLAQSVGPDWTNWTRDINQLASVRQQLGQLLDQLSGSPASLPPSAPANPSPANGATGVSTTPTLTWAAAANATSYNVNFGKSSSPTQVTTTAGTSYSPTGLASSTTYYWQIVATNTAGTAASPVWSFTTAAAGTAPPAPVNPSPATGATGVSLTPALSWGAATGATSYGVYLGTSSATLVATVAGPTYSPSGLTANTAYTWHIVANNSSGSTSSANWTFTTGSGSTPLPAAPVGPNPANGATGVSTSPALSWGAAANATSYDVRFGTSASPPLVTNTIGTTYTPTTLASSTTYYWMVVAKNSSGTANSATWSFKTGSSASVTPTDVSASPNSGSGLQETLTLTYGDANGYADLAGAGAMINSTLNGSNACWVYYNRASSTLSLANNTASTWSPLQKGGTVSNSQCTITSVSATGTGATFQLVLSIAYKATFTGTKNIYGYVQNNAGLNSGYQVMGTWAP